MGFSVCVCVCASVCVHGCVGVCAAVSMVTATPERIELENDGRSSVTEETELLLEVSEETLNRFNLDLGQRCRSVCQTESDPGSNQLTDQSTTALSMADGSIMINLIWNSVGIKDSKQCLCSVIPSLN